MVLYYTKVGIHITTMKINILSSMLKFLLTFTIVFTVLADISSSAEYTQTFVLISIIG